MTETKPQEWDKYVHHLNPKGQSPLVLVCEHASCFIPAQFNDLGLSSAARKSHAAWDPGAYGLAQELSALLDAQLIASAVSRLVYDCNRPPTAPDAMPAQSEVVQVPGNIGLDAAAKAERAAVYYAPFRDLLAHTLRGIAKPAIVTIHSFTPIYHGQQRDVEVGVLHDSDSRFADAIIAQTGLGALDVQRNAPYGPGDGVTHTLKEHGVAHGRLNVMLEVRNDLIQTPAQQAALAKTLFDWISAAWAALTSEAGLI